MKEEMKTPPRIVPSWDDYYMGLTYMIASRSKDPSTQIGAIIVSQDYRPLGMGYNGAPSGFPDEEINWARPDKYAFIDHAEINAMDHAAQTAFSLRDCIIYVSAMPCYNCMRRICAKKIKRVVYGSTAANMLTPDVVNSSLNMAKLGNIQLELHLGDISWLEDRLSWIKSNVPGAF